MRYILTFIFFNLISLSVQSDTIEVTHAKIREGSSLDMYAVDLLRFIIKTSGHKGKFSEYKQVNSQTRKEALLKKGDFDVDWLGATAEIEERVKPIYYPILRGLLGHRVFITNKEAESKLKKGMPIEALKTLKFIQGQGWGDVAILKAGGFDNMMTIPNFENIFKMVENNRVDVFPRSVVEPYGELASRCKLDDSFKCTDRNLMIDNKILVIYKLPILYFFSPTRNDLIDLVNNFFTNQYDQFLTFFNDHSLVKDALKKLEGRTIYKIDNSVLSTKTAKIPEKYWLN